MTDIQVYKINHPDVLRLAAFIADMPSQEYKNAIGGGIQIDPTVATVLAQGILNFQRGAIWDRVIEQYATTESWNEEYEDAISDVQSTPRFRLEDVHMEPVMIDGEVTGYLSIYKPDPTQTSVGESVEQSVEKLRSDLLSKGLVRESRYRSTPEDSEY